jgi:hypothetical protein
VARPELVGSNLDPASMQIKWLIFALCSTIPDHLKLYTMSIIVDDAEKKRSLSLMIVQQGLRLAGVTDAS